MKVTTEQNQFVCKDSSETKRSKFQIPDEILHKIFGYLSTGTILKKIALVNKHFNEISQDPYIIKTLSLNVATQRQLYGFSKLLHRFKGLEILKLKNALTPYSVKLISSLLQRSQ